MKKLSMVIIASLLLFSVSFALWHISAAPLRADAASNPQFEMETNLTSDTAYLGDTKQIEVDIYLQNNTNSALYQVLVSLQWDKSVFDYIDKSIQADAYWSTLKQFSSSNGILLLRGDPQNKTPAPGNLYFLAAFTFEFAASAAVGSCDFILQNATITFTDYNEIYDSGIDYGQPLTVAVAAGNPASEAEITALTVSAGGVLPGTWNGAGDTYTVTDPVPFETVSVDVTVSVTAGAGLTINGVSQTPGAAVGVNLNQGSNTIPISVKSSNGAVTNNYTIVVVRTQGDTDNELDVSGASGGIVVKDRAADIALAGTWDGDTYALTAPVAFADKDFLSLIATVRSAATSTLTVQGAAAVSGTAVDIFGLSGGIVNTVPVAVTSQSGSTKTYYVSIEVSPDPGDNTLSSLTLGYEGGGTIALSPAFDPGVVSYTATAPYGTAEITVAAAASSPEAQVEGTGTTAVPGMVTVTVTAEDGTKKEYTVEVGVSADDPNNPNQHNTPVPGAITPLFGLAESHWMLIAVCGAAVAAAFGIIYLILAKKARKKQKEGR